MRTFRPRSGASLVAGTGARRLDLDLLRDQRLERLITLRLVVLNRGAAERGALAADGAGPKLARAASCGSSSASDGPSDRSAG